MEKATSKQSSLDLQVTDAGFSTKSASSVAGSKRKKINDFALVRMYQDQNLRVSDICASLGISPANMYSRLHKMGIPTRQKKSDKGKRLNKQTISKIHSMRMMGYSKYHIAKHLKIAFATVQYHLLRAPAEPIKAPVTAPIQATITMTSPSVWSRIRSWFN